jgi:hypothetical protein
MVGASPDENKCGFARWILQRKSFRFTKQNRVNILKAGVRIQEGRI